MAEWLILCEPDGTVAIATPSSEHWESPSEYTEECFHIVVANSPDEDLIPMRYELSDDGQYMAVSVDYLGPASSRDFNTRAGVITCPRVYTQATGIKWESSDV